VALRVQRDGEELTLTGVLDAVGQRPAATPATPGFLGVYLNAAAAATRAQVDRCAPGSPAEKAGLRPGDVITSINGQRVGSAEQLAAALRGHGVGARLSLQVQRGRAAVRLEAVLAAAPAAAATPSRPATPAPTPSPAPRARFGAALVVRGGRVVIDEVDPRGPVAAVGLRPGDVLVEAGGRRLRSLEDFEAVFAPRAAGDRLPLLVERDGWEKQVDVQLAPPR
jgi:serine protease Do